MNEFPSLVEALCEGVAVGAAEDGVEEFPATKRTKDHEVKRSGNEGVQMHDVYAFAPKEALQMP